MRSAFENTENDFLRKYVSKTSSIDCPDSWNDVLFSEQENILLVGCRDKANYSHVGTEPVGECGAATHMK